MAFRKTSGSDVVSAGCRKAPVISTGLCGADILSLGLIAVFVLFAAAQAKAQSPVPGSFEPPPGCTGWLTVQSRGCRVSNHYRCEADPAGDQWRADFDQDGIFFVSRIDHETQWIESYDMFPTVRQTLDPNPADPASFSNLLASGSDTFDFGLSEDAGGHSRIRGYDTLTGVTVTIDGIALQETEFDYSETGTDGTTLRQAHGHEYINPEWRLFFAGPSQWETADGPLPVDGSPKQFIFPGEKGFLSTEPIFDCDATMSLDEGGGHAVLPAALRR